MNMVRRRSMRGFYRAMELANSGADPMTDQFLMESDPFTEPVNSVAFVVHGGTIMSILSVICGGDFYDYQTENGGCVTFSVEPPGHILYRQMFAHRSASGHLMHGRRDMRYPDGCPVEPYSLSGLYLP